MQKHDIHYLPVAEDDLNEIVDYLLFYTIKHNRVYVMRVVHGKRNYLPLLKEAAR